MQVDWAAELAHGSERDVVALAERLIRSRLRHANVSPSERDDCAQAARVVVLQCKRRYDGRTQGACTYLVRSVDRAIRRTLAGIRSTMRSSEVHTGRGPVPAEVRLDAERDGVPSWADRLEDTAEPGPEARAEQAMRAERLDAALTRLSDQRMEWVLRARHGVPLRAPVPIEWRDPTNWIDSMRLAWVAVRALQRLGQKGNIDDE